MLHLCVHLFSVALIVLLKYLALLVIDMLYTTNYVQKYIIIIPSHRFFAFSDFLASLSSKAIYKHPKYKLHISSLRAIGDDTWSLYCNVLVLTPNHLIYPVSGATGFMITPSVPNIHNWVECSATY